jgi:uncharacterized SAM-binding protein YcdF (DUF218 family)
MKFLTFIAVLALIWLIGLFVFADRVRGFTPAPEPERADAIVALTGPSAERVNAAIRLLEQDKGKRVLVSGVNRDVRREELRAVTPGSNRLFNCCVDLGFEATDTTSNAQEIAAWARAKDYDSLIVVTSDYHMARSLLEIRTAAPGIKLTPYAVETPSLDNSRWWRAAVTARRMTLEYMKYLAALGRAAGVSRGKIRGRGRTPDRRSSRSNAGRAGRCRPRRMRGGSTRSGGRTVSRAASGWPAGMMQAEAELSRTRTSKPASRGGRPTRPRSATRVATICSIAS